MPKEMEIIVIVVVVAVSIGLATVFLARPPTEMIPAFGEVKLPSPETTGTMSVEEAIAQRRSVRNYTDEPLSLQDLSQLLWAAQGITDPVQKLRAAPSAGATYPLEVHVVVGTDGVTGLTEGVYRYDPFEHKLENILKGDIRSDLASSALGQIWIREAPVDIVIATDYASTAQRYESHWGIQRVHRFVHMEAGHVGQNLYLQAEARGLGMVVVGAFYDDQVQTLLGLPANKTPLYIIPIGHPAG
jgi:SagB-type dehydrogenase family enzyme